MKQVFDFKGSEGMKVLFPELPDEKYLITPGYIMAELKQGEIYITFYIRSLGKNGYIVYVYLPEMENFWKLKHNKPAMLKYMSESTGVAATIKNTFAKTPDQSAPLIENIKDFTAPEGKQEWLWVIRETLPLPFSKQALVEGTEENKYLVNVLNELFRIADDYLGAYQKIRSDYTVADWLTRRPDQVDATIRRCLKDNYLPPFIAQVETIENEEFREALRKEKILMCSEGVVTYSYGMDIEPEHRNLPYTLLMMTEVLDPATKDLDLCFVVRLNPDHDRFIPSIDLGSAQEMGSKLLDEPDKSAKAKIPKDALKYMPKSTYVYFLANNANNGYSVRDYVERGVRVESYSDKDERYYRFDGTRLVVNYYFYMKADDVWEHFESVKLLLDTGLSIIREILVYTPVYMKSFGVHVLKKLVDGMTFFFNPVGKIIKWTRK